MAGIDQAGIHWYHPRPKPFLPADLAREGGRSETFGCRTRGIPHKDQKIMPTPQMTVSDDGVTLIAGFESPGGVPKLSAYQDQRGIWTIGFGHTYLVFPGMTCTPEQARQWLLSDIVTAEACVNVNVRPSMTQCQFDATVSLAFNIGNGDFKNSSVLRLFNAGDIAGAAEDFLMWDKITINDVLVLDPGLLKRRKIEQAVFLNGYPAPEVA
jgi:lysozyme